MKKILNILKKTWNWLDGNKTLIGVLLWIAISIIPQSALPVYILEGLEILRDIFLGVGLGHKAKKYGIVKNAANIVYKLFKKEAKMARKKTKEAKTGIELLKPFILWLFKTGEKFEGLKNYALVRKITIIILSLLAGLKYISKLPELWAQFKDLDEAEAAEIYAEVVEKFDIENDTVEQQIEEYFGYVLNAWLLVLAAGILARTPDAKVIEMKAAELKNAA